MPLTVRIADSTISDLYALANNLRAADAAEITALGASPKSALRICFRNGILRQTAFVESDGNSEIAAMWGLCGAALSDVGEPYLLTTAAVERVPIATVRAGREAVGRMLRLRRELVGHVDANYTRACRFLELLGFTLGDPRPVAPTGALFRPFKIGR